MKWTNHHIENPGCLGFPLVTLSDVQSIEADGISALCYAAQQTWERCIEELPSVIPNVYLFCVEGVVKLAKRQSVGCVIFRQPTLNILHFLTLSENLPPALNCRDYHVDLLVTQCVVNWDCNLSPIEFGLAGEIGSHPSEDGIMVNA